MTEKDLKYMLEESALRKQFNSANAMEVVPGSWEDEDAIQEVRDVMVDEVDEE
jgi:hypothetical protein